MRVWFITGCSSGIGRGIAKAVLHRGYSAVITARDVHDRAERYTDSSLALGLDVTDNADIDRAVTLALERFGKIDVLVNNAGFVYRSSVIDDDTEIIDALFRTHVSSIGGVK